MNQTSSQALPAGTRLENFEIVDVLGTGSFGITYLAQDHSLECEVAIKEFLPVGMAERLPDHLTLRPKSGDDEEWYAYGLKRFLDEARTLARFNAPSIVRVSRFMEAHGTAYFVMDYVRGRPLDRVLRGSRFDAAGITRLATELLRGLAVVHQNHYVHRDIKPGNILLRDDGMPVLLDFGCARERVGQGTQSMTAMGTPAYAPFEQFHEDEVQNPSADIYSLGATLYHCITGKSPPACTSRINALHEEQADPAERGLDGIATEFGAPLIETIRWMMQPYPSDRPQSVDEVLLKLTGTGPPGEAITMIPKRQMAPGPNAVTAPLDTGGRPVATWSDGALKKIETIFADFVGPLSATLVKRAAKRTNVPDTLLNLLSQSIDDLQEREQFTRRAHKAIGGTATHATTAPPQGSVQEAQTRLGSTQAPPSAAQPISAKMLTTATKVLSGYLGPIANILVKKASRQSVDKQTFCRLLADELSDPKEQQAFLKRMEKL